MSKKNSESCVSILFKITILMTVLAIVVMSGIYFAYNKLNEFFNRGGTIDVPDFRGKHIVEVFKAKPEGLVIVRRDEKFDDQQPRDHVIAQYPEPGTLVKQGKKIQLSISLGKQKVLVPDLKSNSMREVDLALLNSQLLPGDKAYIFSEEISHDRVVAQSPMPSEEYGVNQAVDLLISLGNRPANYILPDISGSSLDEGKKRLKALGFNFGRIYSVKDSSRPRFQIISTSPAPYSKVRKGDVISLLISAGNDEGTATDEDLKKFKVSADATAPEVPEQETTESKTTPPQILIAEDEDEEPETVQTATLTSSSMPKEISFVMPDGFMPKEVKFIHITSEGRQQIYSGTHKPLDLIKVKVPDLPNTKVQIYINDVPIEERKIE
ncbi:MAG: PASTA domain-containing protein [Candidatus Rifleibacteriota bacterium]